jgi:hypothetical protein
MEEEWFIRRQFRRLPRRRDGRDRQAWPTIDLRRIFSIDDVVPHIHRAEIRPGCRRGEMVPAPIRVHHGAKHHRDFHAADERCEIVVVAGAVLVDAGLVENQVQDDGPGSVGVQMLGDIAPEFARPGPAVVHVLIDRRQAFIVHGDDHDGAVHPAIDRPEMVKRVVKGVIGALDHVAQQGRVAGNKCRQPGPGHDPQANRQSLQKSLHGPLV